MSRPKRLLFACYHFYLDPSNGASITAREILHAMASRGWDVQTFCGCGLDFYKRRNPLSLLEEQHISPQRIHHAGGATPFTLAHFRDGSIRSTVFLPGENQPVPSRECGNLYLKLLREVLRQSGGSILLTYGGYWTAAHVLKMSHENGLKNAVLVQNLSYKEHSVFRDVDLSIVPSRFASAFYAKTLKIDTVSIPPLMDSRNFLCETNENSRKYVVFINPEPDKGVCLFAGIAKILWEKRPDIPLLIVEGRRGAEALARTGTDLKGLKNINFMPNTPNPRDFYKVSKIVLVPSMVPESFGRVAAEAMSNGIPVICSDRGALPEVVGDAGIVLPVPENPSLSGTPEPELVMPWVESIIKLWETSEYYEKLREKSLARSVRWIDETVASRYEQCFLRLLEW